MRTIHVLRKPCSEGTVAANVLKWGTGALNVDGCRVSTSDALGGGATSRTGSDQKGNEGWTRPWMVDPMAQAAHAERVRSNVARAEALGRWPANVILEEGSVSEALDDQSGILKSAVAVEVKASPVHGQFVSNARTVPGVNQHGGEGGASRFFQHVKVKVKE